MKKILSFVLTVVIVAALVLFIPKLVHTCDSCSEMFFGTGYEPNALTDLIADNETICKTCAEKQHAVEIALGKTVEEYRKPLF